MSAINSITARRILDSRGEWTVEAAVVLTNGLVASASVPQGKSRGSFEASYVEPQKAVRNIEKMIAPELKGFSVEKQSVIDAALIELDGTDNKSKLGANAILGVSLACARAAAFSKKVPLWQHLRELYALKIRSRQKPRLFINLIEGGLHAQNNLAFQEYLVIPKANSLAESISIGTKIYHALKEYLERSVKNVNVGDEGGFAPNLKNNIEPFRILSHIAARLKFTNKIDFGLDAAASNVDLPVKKLFSIYAKMKRDYKLFYLEDPFGENDFLDFHVANEKWGRSMIVAGDDLTVTNLERMAEAQSAQSISGIIIKPNQIGTLSETFAAIRLARKWGWQVIVSHRGEETNDDFIADLAYAVGADGLKLGAPSRGERVAKYNRLLEIERDLSRI